ncbi:MAG: hypothetical protein DRO11_05350 [Methanobacteriota archaeon]|nr:MAG: hypothetical protein DRO11_05350 [Euryarchaeota archaeon]
MGVRDRVEQLTRELVLMGSSNHEKGFLERLTFVESYMADLGASVRRFGSSEHPALAGLFGDAKSGGDKGSGVVLCGHLDTVPVGGGWSRAQGELVGGRVYGRGACDMLGGCAAMLLAAENSLETSFVLCFTTDEETKMVGAESLVKTGLLSGAKLVVVGEPTNLCVCAGERGVYHLRITTRGRSAHAATPEEGENAVSKMVVLLGELEALKRGLEGERVVLGVNVVRGGVKVNVIPDTCVAEVDIRFSAPNTPEKIFCLVRERLDRAGVGYELETMQALPAVSTSLEHPLVAKLVEHVHRETGKSPVGEVPYATECAKYVCLNKPMVILGPGNPKLAHKPDEYVEVSELVDAVELYTWIIEWLGNQDSG